MNETVVSLRNNREIVMSKAKLSLTAYLSMDVYLSSTVNLTFKGRYAITSLFWLLVNLVKRESGECTQNGRRRGSLQY